MSYTQQIDFSDFENLTKKQLEVLGQVSINEDGGHSKSTIKSLLDKGLIESYSDKLPGHPPVTVRRYYMPIHVHIVWCEWCSKKLEATDG